MDKQFPLYPTLSEAGKEEAQALVDQFKEHLKRVANEVISNLYCDVVTHIESDSWTNYRNDLVAGFRNYGNRMVQGEFDFKEIRQAIYKEFREDIIKDLNQDLLKENEELREDIKVMRRLGRAY